MPDVRRRLHGCPAQVQADLPWRQGKEVANHAGGGVVEPQRHPSRLRDDPDGSVLVRTAARSPPGPPRVPLPVCRAFPSRSAARSPPGLPRVDVASIAESAIDDALTRGPLGLLQVHNYLFRDNPDYYSMFAGPIPERVAGVLER